MEVYKVSSLGRRIIAEKVVSVDDNNIYRENGKKTKRIGKYYSYHNEIGEAKIKLQSFFLKKLTEHQNAINKIVNEIREVQATTVKNVQREDEGNGDVNFKNIVDGVHRY